MSFEIKERDLLARIGKLTTKSGTVETPLFFPVVNPAVQPISPRKMREEFDFEALITNAYILRKRPNSQPQKNGLHEFLDFNGTVMTDSGAYQILVYGDIEVSQKEIVEYQEFIGSDIATMLDIPTGWRVTAERAALTVNETLKRAKTLLTQKTRNDLLWVGPVQGGKYLNLVARSAKAMGKLPFDVYALGSPTEVMERYRFDVLADMILTAKMNLPIQKPLHLFGAGHPFMFALATAIGCDLFDSAAYTLFAKESRYMTETGTSRLNELEYFPCPCPRCARTTPQEALEMPIEEKEVFLAEHNLYTCSAELRRIKQAIKEGRLWEHLQLRAHGHPSLLQALKRLKKYQDFMEKHDSTVKKSGLFFFDSIDLMRPEVVRYRRKLSERHVPQDADVLLLVPQTRTKPFHKSRDFRRLSSRLQNKLGTESNRVAVCFYGAPFGVVPFELDEVYPLSQHETTESPETQMIDYVAKSVATYILRVNCGMVMLLNDVENWGESVAKASKKACLRKKIMFECVEKNQNREKTLLTLLANVMGRS